MQMITGGLGFIGAHTARALLDLGQTCVLAQRRAGPIPPFLKDEIGSRVFIEPVDLTDVQGLIEIGKKYDIDGIIHLAGSFAGGEMGIFEDIRLSMSILANVFQAAYVWKAKRVAIASALGVYNGVASLPWREDQPLACKAAFPIEAFKKAGEVFTSLLSNSPYIGFECLTLRIAGIYGPLYNPERRSLVGQLVHAAVHGAEPDFEKILGSSYAEDGFDWCYAKDCGRGIALLMTAGELHHTVYNVASGRPSKNREFVEAIRQIVPGFKVELPAGTNPNGDGAVPYQDITWLQEDTGYQPQFSIQTGIADYIAWLRAGNPA